MYLDQNNYSSIFESKGFHERGLLNARNSTISGHHKEKRNKWRIIHNELLIFFFLIKMFMQRQHFMTYLKSKKFKSHSKFLALDNLKINWSYKVQSN